MTETYALKLKTLAQDAKVGLKPLYFNGRFYYFSGIQYFDANSLEEAAKSITEYKRRLQLHKPAPLAA